MKAWTRARDDEISDFGWRKVVVKHLFMPNGEVGDFVTDTWGADNAAVVALDEDGRLIVAKQYRTGPEKYMYELPGGGCNSGEDPAVTATRELREETGYVSDREPTLIGKICRNAYHMDTTFYYVLTDCRKDAAADPDDREFIEVQLKTIEEMKALAKDAMVSDPAALYFAHDTIKELEEKQ